MCQCKRCHKRYIPVEQEIFCEQCNQPQCWHCGKHFETTRQRWFELKALASRYCDISCRMWAHEDLDEKEW